MFTGKFNVRRPAAGNTLHKVLRYFATWNSTG